MNIEKILAKFGYFKQRTCHLISRFNSAAFWFECTECGGNSLHRYKYCPHCGAKVNGVEN